MLKFVVVLTVLSVALGHGPKPLSKEQLEKLAAWKEGDEKMWQISGQFEGDMVLSPDQKNGLIDDMYRWPNAEIPYEIDGAFTTSEANFIRESLKEFEEKSCVKVRARTSSDRDYVYVTGANTGCWSYVGRLGIGKQELNLQRNGCLWHDTIVHEFLHAGGFYHQQSATERDDHVIINWGNIQNGQQHNFDKLGANVITSYGQPYDYGSVMHYTEYAFSSNGLPTITPVNSDWLGKLGMAPEMSDIDIVKLKAMYKC